MKLERSQILSLYMKIMKKFYKYLNSIASNETRPTVSRLKDVSEILEYYFGLDPIFLLPFSSDLFLSFFVRL